MEETEVGVRNPRAFCPNCGAKIHTHRSYTLAALTFRERWQRTGVECPQCHVPLTGKVTTFGNRAELANRAPTSQKGD
jgi:hypothetical protein